MEKAQALGALSALAQENRLDVFRLLVEAGPAGMPAGRIAGRLGLAAATLSFHLKELKVAGLIGCRREGRSLIYSADFAAMAGLLGFLTEDCCGGHPDICAPLGIAGPGMSGKSGCAAPATETPQARRRSQR